MIFLGGLRNRAPLRCRVSLQKTVWIWWWWRGRRWWDNRTTTSDDVDNADNAALKQLRWRWDSLGGWTPPLPPKSNHLVFIHQSQPMRWVISVQDVLQPYLSVIGKPNWMIFLRLQNFIAYFSQLLLTKLCQSFAFFSVLLSRLFGCVPRSCLSSLESLICRNRNRVCLRSHKAKLKIGPEGVSQFSCSHMWFKYCGKAHLVAVIKEDTGSMAELFTASLAHLRLKLINNPRTPLMITK